MASDLDTMVLVRYSESRKEEPVARYDRTQHNLPKTTIRAGGQETKVYRYRDVLNLAYQHGLVGFEQAAPLQCYRVPSIDGKREVVYWVAEVYAVFREPDGTLVRFHGVGDASVENANRGVAVHAPRLAHTRAKARALADALNLDANLKEEFADIEDNETEEAAEPNRCSRCGVAMSEKSAEVSKRIRGYLLCYRCAKQGGS